MTDPHVISALREKRAKISGCIVGLEPQLDQRRADLTHIDGTLRLFAPDNDPELIRPKRTYAKRTRYFARNDAILHLMQFERDQERERYPLLWYLEDRRKQVEEYSPLVRAAWLGFIDPMIKGLREPLESLRRTKSALQQMRVVDSIKETKKVKADHRAALAYKMIVDEVFETTAQ
jgi:hypothetical protein